MSIFGKSFLNKLYRKFHKIEISLSVLCIFASIVNIDIAIYAF